MAWRINVTLSVALSLSLGLSGCTLNSTPQIEPVSEAIQLGSAVTPSESPSQSSSGSTGTATQTPSAGQPSSPTASPSSSEDEDSDSEDSDSTPASAVYDSQVELEIEDQSGTGKTVRIEEFSISIDNLWLVISTESGSTLAVLLTTTQSKPVNVTLQRPITSSQELVARLYLDDGDGVFEPSQDSPVYEEPGELIDEDFEYVVG